MIDYARFHGLIQDHRLLDPLELLPKPENQPRFFEDPEHAPKFEIPQGFSTNERLTLSKEAATLLSSCTTAPKIGTWNVEDVLDVRHRMRKQKFEIPILRTDQELDMEEFGQRVEPDLAGFNLPYEKVDEENDEGLTWPRKCYGLPQELESRCRGERIETSRDVLIYMQDLLKTSYTEEDEKALLESELRYKKYGIVEPVTPPLLPASPEIVPFVPSSPTGYLEQLSDHTSPTTMQAHEIDKLLMGRDAIRPSKKTPSSGSHSSNTIPFDEDDIGQIYSPLKDIGDTPTSPLQKHVRLDDIRVEAPLTPPMTVQNPILNGKNVSFKEMLQEIIPSLPLPIEEPPEVSLEDIDGFFEEAIAPIADRVNREVEQEQLQEADSTKRMDVPIMDFSLPVPPWKMHSHSSSAKANDHETELDAQRNLISEMKATHMKNHRWPGIPRLELKLPWCPFPKELGKIATQEIIEDDGSISKFLAGLSVSDTLDSSTLTWKQEGLRVLDDDDDSDEELQPGIFKDDKDIHSLIKKRKLELQETAELLSDVVPVDKVALGYDINSAKEAKILTEAAPSVSSRLEAPGSSHNQQGQVLLGGTFSAFNALSNFLDVRGETTKKPKLMDSPYFPTPYSGQPLRPMATVMEAAEQIKDVPLPAQAAKKPLPVPELNPPKSPRPFIISSTIFAQRRIVRRLKNIYPTAEFIERDFTSHSTASEPHLGIPNAFGAEADILVSPSTGLIWTMLQVIKQRSLPGQADRSPIRERIARVSRKYERLVVLISEGREGYLHSEVAVSSALSGLDIKDCEALTEFISFCESLEGEIVVLYTGGGEEELAKWIAGVMI
ncbi:MAG: hypothetical protein M1830_010804, partial [Pleopsidium flavum]